MALACGECVPMVLMRTTAPGRVAPAASRVIPPRCRGVVVPGVFVPGCRSPWPDAAGALRDGRQRA